MTGDADPDTAGDIDRHDPADAFAALASETRVDVLRALADHPDDTVGFADLFERVDVPDSGNFSYHLGKLRGTFVEKTAAGYELTHAGRQVVGAIHAGRYTADGAVGPVSVDWDCLRCGGDLAVAYEDGRVEMTCVECNEGAAVAMPPGAVAQFDRGELPAAAAAWYHQRVRRLLDGFCADCGGRLDGELVGPPSENGPSVGVFECGHCGRAASVSGATIATFHPVTEGFLHEHGFDTTVQHPSQVWAELDESTVTVRTDDPLSLEVRFAHDGEAVSVTLGSDATVEAVDRRPVE